MFRLFRVHPAAVFSIMQLMELMAPAKWCPSGNVDWCSTDWDS